MKVIFIRILLLSLPVLQFAQNVLAQSPPDGANITHTQIMFEYPFVQGAKEYEIGVYEKPSGKMVYRQHDISTAHLVTSGVEFGKQYAWVVRALDAAGKQIGITDTFHFATRSSPLLENMRHDVVQYKQDKVLPGVIATDYGVILNREGKPVWFLDTLTENIRHLKLNPDGQVTFVGLERVYEFDIDGHMLWYASEVEWNNLHIGLFHHQVHKLPGGNYLCLATRLPPGGPKADRLPRSEVIVELDAQNNVQWLWDEAKHYSDTSTIISSHANSVDVSPDGKYLLLGCRDLSTLIKIDRQSGEAVYTIGYRIKEKVPAYNNHLFRSQHAASFAANGGLLLFNNNIRRQTSSIQLIQEPHKKDKSGVLLWEYPFNFENKEENHCSKTGSVSMLPNGNYLVAQGTWYRNFEINPQKEIVWECLTQKRTDSAAAWQKAGCYSVHYMSSLYPCYFTAVAVGQTAHHADILISNEGSEEDTYVLRIADGSKTTTRGIKLKPGVSIHQPVKWKSGSCAVEIQSQLNPAKKKSFIFQ